MSEMQINIGLTRVSQHDIVSDTYGMYFEEFPNAIAVGTTEEEAETNLIPLVELMWIEKPEDTKKVILEKYGSQIKTRIHSTPVNDKN